VKTLYLYDGWDIVALMTAQGQLLESYTRGVGLVGDIGTIVAVTHHAGSWTNGTFYIHHNHRGDIVLTRAGTATVGTYDYSAFGTLKSQIGSEICRFKFSSKELDRATGFYYYGYRFYSPQWQRWVSRDVTKEINRPAFGVLLGYQMRSSVPRPTWYADFGQMEPLAEYGGTSSLHNVGGRVDSSYAYTFAANRPIEKVAHNGAEAASLGGYVVIDDGKTKCYTKKDIPEEVEKKLPDWAKERLEKSCFKVGPLKCYPGVLYSGGVYGVCVKCYF